MSVDWRVSAEIEDAWWHLVAFKEATQIKRGVGKCEQSPVGIVLRQAGEGGHLAVQGQHKKSQVTGVDDAACNLRPDSSCQIWFGSDALCNLVVEVSWILAHLAQEPLRGVQRRVF
jgi:hypothetical protein